jgi:hypothetical protein
MFVNNKQRIIFVMSLQRSSGIIERKMKPHEIQIGSIAQSGKYAAIVREIYEGDKCFISIGKRSARAVPVSDLEPIPITPEWLERLGFEKREKPNNPDDYDYLPWLDVWSRGDVDLSTNEDYCEGFNLHFDESFVAGFEHIHQLQAAFALFTGEMLELKKEREG